MSRRSCSVPFLLLAVACSGGPSDTIRAESSDSTGNDSAADDSARADRNAHSNDVIPETTAPPANQNGGTGSPAPASNPVPAQPAPGSSADETITLPVEDPEAPVPPGQDEARLGEVVHPEAPYCPGIEPGAVTPCESDGDCSEGLLCFYENTPTTCTLGCAGPQDECDDSSPCADGLLCVGTPAAEVSGTCSCGGGRHCVPPCGRDDECGFGERCDADGRCQSIACNEGYVCPTGRTCDVGALGADAHGCRILRCSDTEHPGCGTNLVCDPSLTGGNGCVRQSCTTGSDCKCGACSPHGNECVSRPGYCARLSTPG